MGDVLQFKPHVEMESIPAPVEHEHCGRCGRKLKNPKWRQAGFGPLCIQRERYDRAMAEGRHA